MLTNVKEIAAWQKSLSDLITDPKELWSLLELDISLLEAAYQAARSFPLKVPREFVARMQKGNPHDPLLQQILPLGAELNVLPGYVADPLEEAKANPLPGLLHKYHGRVLVTLTSACAVHCRYCFRRHFPYEENNPGRQGWQKIIDYIAQDKTITEVILSGGDPLAVSDKLLNLFSQQLSEISHLKRLRIHSRLPIVLPTRITPQLLRWLQQLPWDTVLVIHANHPQEINAEVKQALLQLRAKGIHLLNQSVLLKGINDNVDTLQLLSETLFTAGVLPYYLHILDKIEGAAHFDLDLAKAHQLHKELTSRLPGYLVPKMVIEEAGALSKTLVSSDLYTA